MLMSEPPHLTAGTPCACAVELDARLYLRDEITTQLLVTQLRRPA